MPRNISNGKESRSKMKRPSVSAELWFKPGFYRYVANALPLKLRRCPHEEYNISVV